MQLTAGSPTRFTAGHILFSRSNHGLLHPTPSQSPHPFPDRFLSLPSIVQCIVQCIVQYSDGRVTFHATPCET
jgi:hypothetical protein